MSTRHHNLPMQHATDGRSASPVMLKPPSPPSALLGSVPARAPLSSLDQTSDENDSRPINLALHASINTTRSAVDSSVGSSFVSAADSSFGLQHHSGNIGGVDETEMECSEEVELSEADVASMAANYPQLAARALSLASQAALDRVHIQSLEAQVEAARIWTSSLEGDQTRLREERDQWRTKCETHESALRQTQIMLACMKQAHEPGVAAASASHSAQPNSPRTEAFERERRLQSSHHRAALDAKDTLISSLYAERELAEGALRQMRAEYATLLQTSAATRYSDAVLASEQREKFQRLVEQQLAQQRQATEDVVAALSSTHNGASKTT